MPMTEQEEYEYLSLKKKKAMVMSQQVQQPSRPTQTIPQMLGSNLMKAGKDTAQSAGVMFNTAGFGLPGYVSEKVSGQNIFEGKDLSTSQKMMAVGAGLVVPTGALLRPLGWAGKAVVGSKAGQAVSGILEKRLAKNIESKIHNLYNYAVGSKIKNAGDVAKFKSNRISAMKTISDNMPEIKLTNIDTGIAESRIPQNRLDLLHALQQTKQSIWNKVSTLSKGATSKGAEINLSEVATQAYKEARKNIGSATLEIKPELLKKLNSEYKAIKAKGTMSPVEAEDYMKYLNSEIQRMRTAGQAVDYSVKDLYSSLTNKLSTATDDAIEKALEIGGYKLERMKYSALKSTEKEVLGAANKFLRQQGGQGGGITHPIINIWSLEELLQGGIQALTGNIIGAGHNITRAALIRTAGKLSDYFKNPDKRIMQMFELLQKYSQK